MSGDRPDRLDPVARALRDSEERLRHTLEAAEVGTWQWDATDNQVEWSPNIERIFGIPAGSFAGTYEAWLALVHPEDRAAMHEKVTASVGARLPYQAEYRVLRPDGTVAWHATRGYVVGDGGRTLLRGTVVDITLRRLAEDALRMPAQVLESMTEGVCLTDENGVILYTNPAEDRMFGYARGELRGQQLSVQSAYPPEENQRRVAEVLAELRARGEWTGEWSNRKKDGTRFTTRSRITALALDGKPHWVCVQADVTDEVAARDRADRLGESLEAERKRLHDILMQAPAAISIQSGRDHVFRLVNPVFERITGRAVLGRASREAFPEPSMVPIVAMLDQVYATGEAVSGTEVRLRFDESPAGEDLFFNVTFQPLRDARGRVDSVVTFAVDVTEQVTARRQTEDLARALRVSDTRYRGFVARSTEGIWRFELEQPLPTQLPEAEQLELFYRDGYLAECNDAMARMYGYERAEDLLGARLGDFLVRDDAQNSEYLLAFIRGGYRLEKAESHEVDRHGERRIFQNSLVGAVSGNHLLRAWGMQRDVTREVEAREQAEAANRAKDEFLAMLGHELRNPLSPILTALELMKLRDPAAFPRERATIERQVKHVVRLVDDLLDVSRMTRGKVTLARERVDLADAIGNAIELASPLLEQRAHGLTIQVPRGLVVDGDPTRLGQVFANLLTNAAKYTPTGGQITVSAEGVDGTARISVRDTGMGIRAEILPRIFDLFVQERQALDRSEGGLGLGLAIVRSLVQQHGGTVEARSPGPGRGSEFRVSLPLAAPVAAAHPASPRVRPADHPGGWRVLVVDDNEDAASMLADALGLWGHTVRIAHDGQAALRVAEEFVPQVALLDIGLPVMDGYELARRMRAAPPLARTRLLAVTGYGQAKDRSAALEAGFDGHIVKPVELNLLQATLAHLMR